MTRINQSASLVGTIEFDNGNRTGIWIGANSNTGEPIMWQQSVARGSRASRITGANIPRLCRELNHVLNMGEAEWVGTVNEAALDALLIYVED